MPSKNARVCYHSAEKKPSQCNEQTTHHQCVLEAYFAGSKLRTCNCSILVARDSAT
jgi:hypothetical protein